MKVVASRALMLRTTVSSVPRVYVPRVQALKVWAPRPTALMQVRVHERWPALAAAAGVETNAVVRLSAAVPVEELLDERSLTPWLMVERLESEPRFVVERNITRTPRNPPKECLKIFGAAVVAAMTRLYTSADARRRNEAANGGEVEEGFSKEEADEAGKKVGQAVVDLANCLRKKDAPEKLRRDLLEEAKEIGEALGEYAAARFKPFLKGKLDRMLQQIDETELEAESSWKQLLKEVGALESVALQMNDEFLRSYREVAAVRVDIANAMKGLTKAYADLIKEGDGATSVSPKVVKALERYAATGDENHLDEARSELSAQLKKVKAAGSKADPEFVAGMELFIKSL